MSAKELHDQWLEQKPEGAKHPEDCPFCLAEEETTGGAGESMSDEKTYTSEELAAAVALAVQPLKEKITELEAKDAEAEVTEKIAEATAALEAQVSELQNNLDVKVAELASANQALEDLKAYLEAEAAAAAEAEAREERKTARLDEVKANANYSDEYLAEHADRWADMAEGEFAGLIADLKAAGVKGKDDVLPPDTGLNASRETAAAGAGEKSSLRTILDLRRAGIDAARVH